MVAFSPGVRRGRAWSNVSGPERTHRSGVADTVLENNTAVDSQEEGATHVKGPYGSAIAIGIECQVTDHGGSCIDFVYTRKKGHTSEVGVGEGCVEWLGS